MQKRLLLGNLKELYQKFKEIYPEDKFSFSKFASLRPKECILAGANGTHSVCVCVVHQNVKLMLMGANLSSLVRAVDVFDVPTDCKQILAKMLCEAPTHSCQFGRCESCPAWVRTYCRPTAEASLIKNGHTPIAVRYVLQ